MHYSTLQHFKTLYFHLTIKIKSQCPQQSNVGRQCNRTSGSLTLKIIDIIAGVRRQRRGDDTATARNRFHCSCIGKTYFFEFFCLVCVIIQIFVDFTFLLNRTCFVNVGRKDKHRYKKSGTISFLLWYWRSNLRSVSSIFGHIFVSPFWQKTGCWPNADIIINPKKLK